MCGQWHVCYGSGLSIIISITTVTYWYECMWFFRAYENGCVVNGMCAMASD